MDKSNPTEKCNSPKNGSEYVTTNFIHQYYTTHSSIHTQPFQYKFHSSISTLVFSRSMLQKYSIVLILYVIPVISHGSIGEHFNSLVY